MKTEPTTIKNKKVIYGITDRRNEPFLVKINDLLIDHSGISAKEKLLFFQSIKVLVKSGVRLIRALEIYSERAKNKRFQRILWTVSYDMNKRGDAFSKALSKYPNVFSRPEVQIIVSAEATGNFESTLATLVDQIRKNLDLRMKVKSAMMYPLTIFSGLFLAIAVLMIYVVPKFKNLFSQNGAELPTSTKILISSAEIFQNYWWLIFGGIIVGVLMFKNWIATPKGNKAYSEFLLHAPIVGRFTRDYNTIQIAENLSVFLRSGLDLPKALGILSKILQNRVYSDAITAVNLKVKKGVLLHEALKNYPFDDILSEVVSVGEMSGDIPDILSQTGAQYKSEFDAQISNISRLIEPLIIVIVAGFVVLLAMAVLTPIFQLQEVLS